MYEGTMSQLQRSVTRENVFTQKLLQRPRKVKVTEPVSNVKIPMFHFQCSRNFSGVYIQVLEK